MFHKFPPRRKASALGAVSTLVLAGVMLSRAQESGPEISPEISHLAVEGELGVNHAECSLFGPKRDLLSVAGMESRRRNALSALTEDVVARLGPGSGVILDQFVPGGSRTNSYQQLEQMGTIDRYLFGAMQEAGANPAPKTNDFEFIRRVTLDLTGRIPAPERVTSFVNDPAADKRARLVEELLNKPEWVDKWSMYFGDLFKNTTRNTQITRYAEGRDAFYRWIRESLAANKPYNRIATELITARGSNSYEQGELNWLVGGVVTGGPRTGQDNFDQQAANVAETFLGLGHMNCILCHDGRRHLDTLSLWGKTATRFESWELAAFLSRTTAIRRPVGAQPQPYYWSIDDNTQFRTDYPLNTTTGNRPPRQPVGTMRNVAPVYPFSGRGPASGENHRDALAREITADIQFARAAVNYIWKEFYGRGLVEPVNQFDLARLDPDNPPPEPWSLQPSNARLLNALAQDFADMRFDLKGLMRRIVTSEAYQLSARYEGSWNPEWEKLFARKLVRRLWAEEIHDAVAQSSNVLPSYNIRTLGRLTWAMQLPEPVGLPGGAVSTFLDSFLRGDRDEEERRPDGSPSQALALMNDRFVVDRSRSTGTGATASLVARSLPMNDDQLVDNLFLTILSRYPTSAERTTAVSSLRSGNRTQKAEDLAWSLYNKVDFIFNY